MVRVTFSFPPRNVTQEEVFEFMKTVGNVARCATPPVPCQVSRELTATSPEFVRSTVLASTMTFRLTFPESTFNGSLGTAVPAPAGAARANAARNALTSTPLTAPVYSTDRTITFTLQLAGEVAAFTESVRSEIASAIATAASVNASLCTETCVWASDGDCDDGGPGLQYTSCAIGTDCTDCGVRKLVELNVTSCSVVACGTATGVILAVHIRTLAASATTVHSSISNAISSPTLATLMLANVNVTGVRRARRLAASVIAIMAMPDVISGPNVIGAFGITNLPHATITSAAVPYYKPPSPPPAPPPPAAPPGLCSNTCDTSGSGGTPGVCNDGVSPDPFPFRQLCPFGSDCNDCGSRDFCVTCSLECQRRNNALTDRNRQNGCMESMYADAVCDPNCNNRECGYDAGACTQSQIRPVCMAEQDLGRIDYSTKPEALGLLVGASDGSFGFLNSTLSPGTSTHVMGLVPVALSLDLSPIRLVLQNDFNENYIFAEMTYTLQWADPRLARSPCAGALSGMLSLDFEQGMSQIAREAARAMRSKFWVPSLVQTDAVPGYRGLDDTTDFSLGTETILIDGAPGSRDEGLRVPIPVQPWLDGYGTELPESAPSATPSVVLPIAKQFTSGSRNTSACVGCASWTGDIEFQLLQSHHIYFFYPFDQQELRLTVEVTGAWLYGCVGTGADSPVLAAMGLTEENKDTVLLPPTAEWYLNGPLSESVRVAHPFNNGVEEVHRCEVVMFANRNPTVFIFRALVTTIIVVFGSLLTAIFMHAEEHSGDRASVLYIAFLISLTNMATTNLGLGKVSALLWYDLFNLSQLLLSLIAVAETMVVHLLFKHNAAKLATHIDSVCRQTLPALYIGVTAGIFIYGIGRGRELYTSVGFAIMGIFIITMIPATLFFVWVRQGRLGRWQAKCIKELKKADPDDGEEYDKAVGQVFHAFDVDESGELDTDELRDLFVALHPKISRDDLSSCIRCMSAYVDPASGVLTEPKFLDALIEGERTLSQRIKERNTGPKVPMLRMKTRDLGQFQEDPMAIADDEREKVLEEDVIRRHRKIGTPDTDASPLVTMPQRAEVVTVSSTSTNSLGGADRSHIAQFAKGDKVLYTTKAFGPQIRAEIKRVHTETTPPCYTIRYEGLAIEKQTEEHQLTLAFPPPPPPSGSPASALALEASQKLKEQVSEQVSNETQEARRV